MTEEMKFFLFLIEKYAEDHDRSTGEVFREWDEKGIIHEIFDGYWQYHQERIENAYDDIDSLVATGKHCFTEPQFA